MHLSQQLIDKTINQLFVKKIIISYRLNVLFYIYCLQLLWSSCCCFLCLQIALEKRLICRTFVIYLLYMPMWDWHSQKYLRLPEWAMWSHNLQFPVTFPNERLTQVLTTYTVCHTLLTSIIYISTKSGHRDSKPTNVELYLVSNITRRFSFFLSQNLTSKCCNDWNGSSGVQLAVLNQLWVKLHNCGHGNHQSTACHPDGLNMLLKEHPDHTWNVTAC